MPKPTAPIAFARPAAVALVLAMVPSFGCTLRQLESPAEPFERDTISVLSPRCAGIDSCVVGHVTATGSSAPVAKAAVFLERDGPEDEAVRIQTLTDEQGVFTINDPPPGSYRIAVYKNASRVELNGMELGREGTTVLPVRLAVD